MSCISCNKCELAKFANSVCVQGEGPKKTKVMIVGDNPNYAEDNKGEYGHGNSHKLLLDLLYAAGLDMADIYYTPAVKCRKAENGKVSATQLKACKEHLAVELDSIKPDWIITLGSTALKAVTGKAKITEVNGRVIEHKSGFKVLPTFHPSMSLRDPRFWDRIHADFRKFGKIINGEELVQHKLDFSEIKTMLGLKGVLDQIRRSAVVAFDLETNGLQMRLRTSQIGITVLATKRKQFVITHDTFTFEEMLWFHQECNRLLQGKEVLAHNGKFDNLWLHYIFGVRFPLTFDTMLASHLLDENSPNGLDANAISILEAENWDVPLYIKNGMGKNKKGLTPEERKQRIEYAGWDGYYTQKLYTIFKDRLEQDEELNALFHTLVMPVARGYEQVEINGVHVDLENMRKAEMILRAKMRRIKRQLGKFINPWHNEGFEVNWNSAPFVNRVLFDWLNLEPMGLTDGGAPSTAEDNLVKMKGQHEIIEVLLEYRGAFKQLSSFIQGWATRMIDGQLFPGYKIHGTVTGRPSCSDPNLQQVPRDPFIRSLIGAVPGWTFFEVDFSQIELRIAAVVSGEETMLRIFREGGDIHESTYHMIFGYTPEEAVKHITDPQKKKAQLKEERKKAKAVNFGFIYGMGWKKFKEYAATKFGLNVTDAEAKAMRKRFFEVYPGLVAWHNRQRRIVRAMKQVRTHTGRIRHLPQIDSPDNGLSSEAERNAINAPVQGFGAEMLLMAMVEVNEYFGNNLLKVGGTIHDAMVGIVRNDVALECMARVKKIMESPRIMRELGIELPLPIIADVSLGNWGIAKEYAANDLPPPIELDEFYEKKKTRKKPLLKAA